MDTPTPQEPGLTQAQRAQLEQLYAQAGARAEAIQAARAHWPCRRGCDHCCRHLAHPLPVTRAEWSYLWEGFTRLPAETQTAVRERLARMQGASRPYTCPLLDPATGACSVYAHRPLACRSYGFSVSRGEVNGCHLIAQHLAQETDEGLLWAHQEALDAALRALDGGRGPLSFFEWFAAHPVP